MAPISISSFLVIGFVRSALQEHLDARLYTFIDLDAPLAPLRLVCGKASTCSLLSLVLAAHTHRPYALFPYSTFGSSSFRSDAKHA